MRVEDYLKGETAAIEHCSTRELCPIGALCGLARGGDGSTLFPAIVEVGRGEMLWTDLRFEHRVFVVRSGIFVCMVHGEQGEEIPFSLFGSGIGIGLAELYIPREASNMYYLKAIIPGRVCSLPAKTLRHRLEAMPYPYPQRVLGRSLANQSAASLTQSKIVARQPLYDRIVMLLLCIRELAARGGQNLTTVNLTHSDIATLVVSDRVSTTRVLHKIQEDGLIDLGYKSVRLNPAIDERKDLLSEARSVFYRTEEV